MPLAFVRPGSARWHSSQTISGEVDFEKMMETRDW